MQETDTGTEPTVSRKRCAFCDGSPQGKSRRSHVVGGVDQETLSFERQRHLSSYGGDVAVLSPASSCGRVAELPHPWADWARGWAFYKVLEIAETAGLGRSSEPVETAVEFSSDQVSDLRRGGTRRRIDAGSGTLREVPSQVCRETIDGEVRSCRLLLQVDLPAKGRDRVPGSVRQSRRRVAGIPQRPVCQRRRVRPQHRQQPLLRPPFPTERPAAALQFRRGFGIVPYGAPLEQVHRRRRARRAAGNRLGPRLHGLLATTRSSASPAGPAARTTR